jgi:hypothetical protein
MLSDRELRGRLARADRRPTRSRTRAFEGSCRRAVADTRGDNVFLAWSRVALRTFKLEATLPRRVWTDCPTRSGGSFQLYCDARAASKPYARACRRVVEVAETAGAKAVSQYRRPAAPASTSPAQACSCQVGGRASHGVPRFSASGSPSSSSSGARPCVGLWLRVSPPGGVVEGARPRARA